MGQQGTGTHTIKIRDVPTEQKRLWERLKIDLAPDGEDKATHNQAFEHLMDRYEDDPDAVLDGGGSW